MLTKNKRAIGILLGAPLLLLIPFIAMQFTDEVKWTPLDFMVAGGLLIGGGMLIEFTIRKVKESTGRIIVLFVILALLLLTWMELAVGIFGTPLAGN